MVSRNYGRAIRKYSVDLDGQDVDVQIISLPRRPLSQILGIEVSNTITVDVSWKSLGVGKGTCVLMQPKRKKMR